MNGRAHETSVHDNDNEARTRGTRARERSSRQRDRQRMVALARRAQGTGARLARASGSPQRAGSRAALSCEGRLDLPPPAEASMTNSRNVPAPVPPAPADRATPWLAIERLDVYRVAVQFLGTVPRLVPARGAADLRDQIERAFSSIVLNLGEGAGRISKPDRARFFAIARGSATECAAILDVPPSSRSGVRHRLSGRPRPARPHRPDVDQAHRPPDRLSRRSFPPRSPQTLRPDRPTAPAAR